MDAGRRLIEEGVLTPQQLKRAQVHQSELGDDSPVTISRAVVDLGMASAEQVADVLGQDFDWNAETTDPPSVATVADTGIVTGITRPEPELILGRFEVIRLLGSGGMGAVYLARDPVLDRQVAVKTLRSAHATPRQLTRFQREIKVVAKLRHPNIITIYEANTEAETPFFVMDAIEGETLDQWVERTSLESTIRVVAQVARAIHEAHELGILHRDLKPANIMVEPSGRAIVMDFGLAALTEMHDSDTSRLTREGSAIGTPTYMSPEQARGETDQMGPGSDVFSLGVILYQCLTGRLPFEANNLIGLVAQIVTEQPTPPSSVVEGLPAGLEAICLKCLEKEPQQRYTSTSALAEDLERCLEPAASPAAAPTARPSVTPILVFGLLLIVMVGVVGVGLGVWLGREKSSPPEAETAETKSADPESPQTPTPSVKKTTRTGEKTPSPSKTVVEKTESPPAKLADGSRILDGIGELSRPDEPKKSDPDPLPEVSEPASVQLGPPVRHFTSSVPLRVVVVIGDKRKEVGRVPRDGRVGIPSCDTWFVQALNPRTSLRDLAAAVRAGSVPGLRLQRLQLDRHECLALEGLSSLAWLELSQCQPCPDLAGHLKRIPNLTTLRLDRTATPLLALRDLPALKTLDLILHTSPKDLSHLTRLTQAETLHITFTDRASASDAHLAALVGLKTLRSLSVEHSDFTERGLSPLGSLRGLESLVLSARVEEDGLEPMASLSRLRSLTLSNATINDEGLKHLRGLSRLTTLDLSGSYCKWTDEGAEHLAGLTALRTLELATLPWKNTRLDTILRHRGISSLRVVVQEPLAPALAQLTRLPRLRELTLGGVSEERDVAQLPPLPTVTTLELERLDLDERRVRSTLNRLKRFPGLTRLELPRNRSDSDLLAHLPLFPHLASLSLSHNQVGNGSTLQHLQRFKTITTLKLDHWKSLKGTKLKYLAALPNLRSLDLSACPKLVGADLVELRGLASLEELNLSRCSGLSNEGLEHLAQLEKLERLNLSHTKVSDQGLVHIAKIQGLKELQLDSTRVHDAGVAHLARLPSLTLLDLTYTYVKEPGLDALRAALPNCFVISHEQRHGARPLPWGESSEEQAAHWIGTWKTNWGGKLLVLERVGPRTFKGRWGEKYTLTAELQGKTLSVRIADPTKAASERYARGSARGELDPDGRSFHGKWKWDHETWAQTYSRFKGTRTGGGE